MPNNSYPTEYVMAPHNLPGGNSKGFVLERNELHASVSCCVLSYKSTFCYPQEAGLAASGAGLWKYSCPKRKRASCHFFKDGFSLKSGGEVFLNVLKTSLVT
ncbi:UNVERIFIED_CONTAM: hypothetical protein K2H54_062715 [Gekko kuhli]